MKVKHGTWIVLGLLVSVLAVLAPAPAAAQASTCTVTSGLDSGPGTLRDHLNNRNCNRIVFDNDYTIRLSAQLIVGANYIRRQIIDATGHHVVISGEGNVPVMRVVAISDVVFFNLTITKGYCGTDCLGGPDPPGWGGGSDAPCEGGPGDGGAIRVGCSAELSIQDCTFSDNVATGSGGAIYMSAGADLLVTQSNFLRNRAAARGGAVGPGNHTIQRTGETYYWDSRFIGNHADGSGGAISSYGPLTLEGSTLSGNSAGGNGGGVSAYYDEVAVVNSTLSGNTAAGAGGGIWDYKSLLYLTNSTLSGNSAPAGGGLYGRFEPYDSWGFHGAGVARNSILANNTGGNCLLPAVGWNAASKNNLADDGSCGSNFTTSPIIQLAPLGNYGGLTETMPLLPGSSAIDSGDTATCAEFMPPPLTLPDNSIRYPHSLSVRGLDQRGVTRPQGPACDIGAFELGYWGMVQQPTNPDGASVFNANRGVVPIKFSLTYAGQPTCTLPPATISVQRLSAGGTSTVNESDYVQAADSGSNFRIDQPNCQYVYNLAASSLGVGSYQANISIGGMVSGYAKFTLK